MSTRDVHDQIQDLYGMELSAEMVSKITDRILTEIICIGFKELAILLSEKKFDSMKVMIFDGEFLHI